MEEYILFDNVNTYKDFKLLVESISISEAPVKEETLEIPRSRWKIRFFICFNR